MIPDFLQSPESLPPIVLWKSIIGTFIILFLSFVGLVIRLLNEDIVT